MEPWQSELRAFLALAMTDPSAASIRVRERFDEARSACRHAEAMALAQALQVLMDTGEWYEDIAPYIRSQPETGLRLVSIGTAEENLGLLEAAFDSYARAVLAEQLMGDVEALKLAVTGLSRVLERKREQDG